MIKKLLMSAVGAGIVYLIKNKGARDSLIQKAQSYTRKTKQPQM
jgi:hypothetical protein